MTRELIKILGINPGTRYLGIAVIYGQELIDWRIKVLEGKWSERKINKAKDILSDIIERYEPNVLVIKKLHPARRTENLLKLLNMIKNFARLRRLKVYQYSIKEIEKHSLEKGRLNKQNLLNTMLKQYPALQNDFKNMQCHMNSYYLRAFEAVALACTIDALKISL